MTDSFETGGLLVAGIVVAAVALLLVTAAAIAAAQRGALLRLAGEVENIDRRVREEWEERGATDLHARCLAKAREVLADYQPVQLDDDVKQRIHAIVEETDRLVGVG